MSHCAICYQVPCACPMPAGSARILADILASGPIRPGHQHSTATHVDGREAPRLMCRSGLCPHCTSDGHSTDPDAATVEACARAACEAHPSDPEWAISTEGEREMWRKVARAVLAAAKGAGR